MEWSLQIILGIIIIGFARKLERERDEAVKSLSLAQLNISDLDKKFLLLEQERDQLRKVCDEMAERLRVSFIICERNGIGAHFDIHADAIKYNLYDYNALPHVQERSKQ